MSSPGTAAVQPGGLRRRLGSADRTGVRDDQPQAASFSGGEQGWVEVDLGAVGAVGAPSVFGWCVVVAFDAVAVVNLGVMAFAEQG
jgi:hypothetical protein